MIPAFHSSPNGITQKMGEHRREWAAVPINKGVSGDFEEIALLGVFPFISVFSGKIFPIFSPYVSPNMK